MINALHQLREVAWREHVTVEDIRDDAMQGTMEKDDWRCCVPPIIADLWPVLEEETRLCVYLTIARIRKAGA